MSELFKVGLLDFGQEILTSTTKTGRGGLLRLILGEDPWNRQQSLQYNSTSRLGSFESFGKNSECRKVGHSQIVRNQYGKSHKKARPNFAKTTQQTIENLGWEFSLHPAYWSDLRLSFVRVDATLPRRENFSRNWKCQKTGRSVFCF